MIVASRAGLVARAAFAVTARCGIATSSLHRAKPMPPRPPPINEEEFTETFLKGTGPGGQKINKTSSAVQLKHIPSGLVLKVQATRSRTQNRKIARQMLADRLEELEKGSQSRIAVVGETKRKRKSSAVKKSKRKYKALDAAKAQSVSDEDAAPTHDDTIVDQSPGSNDTTTH